MITLKRFYVFAIIYAIIGIFPQILTKVPSKVALNYGQKSFITLAPGRASSPHVTYQVKLRLHLRFVVAKPSAIAIAVLGFLGDPMASCFTPVQLALTSPTNIKLSWKGLAGTNTLVFYGKFTS
jgi:hypothetical protein